MFRKLLSKIFSQKKDQSASTNYFYFEESRGEKAESEQDLQESVQTFSFAEQSTSSHSVNESLPSAFFTLIMHPPSQGPSNSNIARVIEDNIVRLLQHPKYIVNSLPIVPAALSQIIEKSQSEDFDVDELIALIEQDAIIAAKVIELANSSIYNRSGKDVVDLHNAFMLLGQKGLTEGVINGFISKMVPTKQVYYKSYGKLIWQHSQMTGQIAKDLAISQKLNQSEAYLLGLLTNLGNMVIFHLLVDAFAIVSPDDQPNSEDFKRLVLKYGSELTLNIAKQWGFPRNILKPLVVQTKIIDASSFKAYGDKYPMALAVFEARQLAMAQLLIDHKKLAAEELEDNNQLMLLSGEAQRYTFS